MSGVLEVIKLGNQACRYKDWTDRVLHTSTNRILRKIVEYVPRGKWNIDRSRWRRKSRKADYGLDPGSNFYAFYFKDDIFKDKLNLYKRLMAIKFLFTPISFSYLKLF